MAQTQTAVDEREPLVDDQNSPWNGETLNVPQHPETEAVARRAYELFEERGFEHGHDLDDWLEAERELTVSRMVAS